MLLCTIWIVLQHWLCSMCHRPDFGYVLQVPALNQTKNKYSKKLCSADHNVVMHKEPLRRVFKYCMYRKVSYVIHLKIVPSYTGFGKQNPDIRFPWLSMVETSPSLKMILWSTGRKSSKFEYLSALCIKNGFRRLSGFESGKNHR